MASHFTSIGFQVESMDDVIPLAEEVVNHHTRSPCGEGIYWQWPVGEGVELWVHTSEKIDFQTMVPHFSGAESGKVRVITTVPGDPGVPLVGGFYVWAGPNEENEGTFPFIFEAPDPKLASGYTGEIVPVQISAFAHEVFRIPAGEHANTPEERFIGGMKLAEQAFVPTGLFGDEEKDLTQKAVGLFCGEVLSIQKLKNQHTEREFFRARVATLELKVDVLIDPELLEEEVTVGDTLQVSAWLSGRILLPPEVMEKQQKEEKPKGWFKRLFGG